METPATEQAGREQFLRLAEISGLTSAEWLALTWIMVELIEKPSPPRAVDCARKSPARSEHSCVEQLRQEARQAIDTLLRQAAYRLITSACPEASPPVAPNEWASQEYTLRSRLKLAIWNHLLPTRLRLRLMNSRLDRWLTDD